MTVASFENNKNNNIDIVIQPIKDNNIISEPVLYEMIKSSEYTALYTEPSNIKNAIAELNSVLKPLQDKQTGREIRYEILIRKDASISISIDSDEMSASAEITTAQGGKHLTAKAILNAAQEAGVIKGFSKEVLLNLAKHAAKELPGSLVKGVVAHGKDAINGKNAQIKLLVQSAQDRILRPVERDDGSVDMRDLGEIICVKIGEPLAKKIPLTQGIKGFTVLGSPLDPTPGDDLAIKAGQGTVISEKNNNVLVSTLVGLPRAIENGVEVDEIYNLKNVDISTGHIKFEGSVLIENDVCEGMKVIASGDITVGGFVESAQLEAGGDITINGGIIGRKQEVDEHSISDIQMTATINAEKNIFAKYCQYAEISCQELRIENQLMHSIVSVKDRVWVGAEDKANGKLIAGYMTVGTSVHAGTIGATAGSSTIINFDDKIADFKLKITKLEELAEIESEKTDELKKASNKLRALPKEKQNKEMLTKVINAYRQHAEKLGEILNNKILAEEKLQQYMASIYVEANEKIYQDVQLFIDTFHERTKREYGPSKMNYRERKIHVDPIVNS